MVEPKDVAGILSVRIIAGRHLKEMIPGSLLLWRSGSSNPYVKLQFDTTIKQSTIMSNTITPNWGREQYEFNIRLPSEMDIGTSAITSTTYHYDPKYPKLLVQVFHHDDEKEDVIIGETTIDLLSTIYHTSSGTREWHSIFKNQQKTGELLLALHYDPQGVDPCPNDIIRLTNFGPNMFTKLIPLGTRLQVMDVSADKIFASYKSTENWTIKIEVHRNNIHVIHRPNILTTAQTNITKQISKIKTSRLGNLVAYIPPARQNQLFQTAYFAQFLGKEAYNSGEEVCSTLQKQGFREAIASLKEEIGLLYQAGYRQCLSLDWSGNTNQYDIEEENRQASNRIQSATISTASLVSDENNDCPSQLICPITGCRMIEPVVAADGHSYDKEAILQWFANNNTSPMTGMIVPTTQVFPNYTLKKLLDESM